jgi:hypothetical protein
MRDPVEEWAAVVSRRPLKTPLLEVFCGSKLTGACGAVSEREVYMLLVGLERVGGEVGARSGDGS